MRLERLRERAEMIRTWEKRANDIAAAASKVLGGDVEVYVFGSAVRGEATAASDIDILVVLGRAVSSLTERNRLKILVEDAADLPSFHPFEVHIVGRDEAEHYFRHAGPNIMRLKPQKTA